MRERADAVSRRVEMQIRCGDFANIGWKPHEASFK
jgi:hypothetical protein